jgi:DNA-binding NarL/FixJ family response regulator
MTKTLSDETYRVLLADDHAVVRHGLRALLESQTGVVVCAEASDGREAVELCRKHKPNLAILDLTMPTMDGLEATCIIRREYPETQVLILTMHFSEDLARKAFLSGSLGYVLKSDADEELLAAVDHMRRLQPFFTARLALSMAQNYVHGPRKFGRTDSPPTGKKQADGLLVSPREIDVLRLLANGKSNKEVASELGISIRTAETHRGHLMRKLNCKSFSELVRLAIRRKLVDL